MKRKCLICFLCISFICICSGCSFNNKKQEQSYNISEVADLAVYECYYHGVATIYQDPDGNMFNVFKKGYKKMWVEYDATVDLGIDTTELSYEINQNAFKITLPEIKCLNEPEIDSDSLQISESETGIFTKITTEDEKDALANAQDDLIEKVNNDSDLKELASKRIKNSIESYIKKTSNEDYTIVWLSGE